MATLGIEGDPFSSAPISSRKTAFSWRAESIRIVMGWYKHRSYARERCKNTFSIIGWTGRRCSLLRPRNCYLLYILTFPSFFKRSRWARTYSLFLRLRISFNSGSSLMIFVRSAFFAFLFFLCSAWNSGFDIIFRQYLKFWTLTLCFSESVTFLYPMWNLVSMIQLYNWFKTH